MDVPGGPPTAAEAASCQEASAAVAAAPAGAVSGLSNLSTQAGVAADDVCSRCNFERLVPSADPHRRALFKELLTAASLNFQESVWRKAQAAITIIQARRGGRTDRQSIKD
jgi:hypothetical protein